MTETQRKNPELLRRLAWTGAALAFGLIVLGGVVRITGSGMGCGEHWPRCHGEWFPPLDLPTMIEIGHRWAAALVSLVVLALTAVAWARHRSEPRLRTPATLASVLLVVQVLLGAVTVKLALPPWVVITHLANAMALLAVLIMTALRAGETDGPASGVDRHRLQKLAWVTAGFGFIVILFGAQVANFSAGLLCLGLPLCNGTLLPPPAPLAALHWTHRVLAFLFFGLVLTLTTLVLRDRTSGHRVRRWTLVVAGVTVLQLGVGAVMVTRLLPGELRAAHLLVGTLLWATLVVLVFQANRISTVVSARRKTHA
ncbi:MAG: COX15/CtaA family protein, partial [Gemmatimonadales bacterium]